MPASVSEKSLERVRWMAARLDGIEPEYAAAILADFDAYFAEIDATASPAVLIVLNEFVRPMLERRAEGAPSLS